MALRIRITFVLLWMVSLIVVRTLVSAQVRGPAPGPPPGTVLSGNDVGFRLGDWNGKVLTGSLVVRVNGEWVDAMTTSGTRIVPLIK